MSDNATLCPIVFASKGVSNTEQHYSNLKCEALGILHGKEKFHLYYFDGQPCIITEHKLLLAIFTKDLVTLSQQLQYIMLYRHQYRVHSINNHWTDLHITDWLFRNNHTEDKDQGITSRSVNVNVINTTVDIPLDTLIEDTQMATH